MQDILNEDTISKVRVRKEMANKLGNVTVIDMTGPEQKILKSKTDIYILFASF